MKGEDKSGWFHCGRCGEFFHAEQSGAVPDACSECGRDPVVDHQEVAFAQAASASDRRPAVRGRSEGGEMESKRRAKTESKRSRLAGFVALWVLLLLVVIGITKVFKSENKVEREESLGFGILSEDQRLISSQLYPCKLKVKGYLEAGAPENRAEFLMNPGTALQRMVGRQLDLAGELSEEELQHSVLQVIETPKGKSIETVWEIDRGRKLEAVFFEDEQGEWKIDWANMVRYSEKEWSLFLAGSGAAEGEFRLLARRRSVEDSGKIASVVLIGPRADSPGELGASSPEVKIEPGSRIGRILTSAFARRDAGKGAYGSEAIANDPNGMIRIRAKVLRDEEDGQIFSIREIFACHWYDLDDLGLSE